MKIMSKLKKQRQLSPTNLNGESEGWWNIKHQWLTALAAGFIAAGIQPVMAAEASMVTIDSLLTEMTDLAGMAEFPNPAYTCKQFSSYDRKSKSPTEDWFANGDCGQYLRVENKNGRQEYVMMDAEGPGAVVRIWSANPAGVMRIYLDGAESPILQVPMSELLGGKFPGLQQPIAGEYSKGWNLYLPIPYAKSCKITSDKGGFYYHVNYRTYNKNISVESFSLTKLKELQPRIENLVVQLSSLKGYEQKVGGMQDSYSFDLPAGETIRQAFEGTQAFTFCTAKVDAKNREAALRGIIVKCTFDGQTTVEAPLGDFFGSAPNVNPYSSLPLGMNADGEMYCNWFMPFKEKAEFEFVNTSKEDAAISGRFGIRNYTWTDRSMHFHAKWRAQWDVPTRPMIDWNYLEAKGMGVFAGVSFSIDNPVKAWWGEGDEKIYVDGETFPSHFGTGTEDYYGYAWCWPQLFTHAYHSQSRCDGPGNYGRTSVNRFHILDKIPFTKSFKFDMELWHWDEKCKVNMAVVSYWYAKPGATDTFKSIQAEDAIVRPMPEYVVPRVAGAIEGETMKILDVDGKAEPQDWDSLSAGKHLWWHVDVKPKNQLRVAFEAPKAGKYKVFGRFLKAKDYGIHQLAINGEKAGEPIDFYDANVTPTKEINLGTFSLKEGQNVLSVTVTGANTKAVKSYMFGLDYLLLKSAD